MSFVDNIQMDASPSGTFFNNTAPIDLDHTLPPPYSSNDSVTNQGAYSPPTLETHNASPPPTNQPDFSLLELELLETCNSSSPYYSSCVLEERFLLLGHATNGLQVVDLKAEQEKPPKTIIWIQARQLKAISTCGILLVLPDRTKKVRCYSMGAILRLCYGVLGLEWCKFGDLIFPLGDESLWFSANPKFNQESRTLLVANAVPSRSALLTLNGVLNKRYMWKKGTMVLQDYCYKFPNSKDALSMHVYSTTGYIFVAVLQRDRILLWQRQRHSSSSSSSQVFSPLKEFWIPAEAQTISFADDRMTLRYIIAVFPHGASLIGIQNSKVTTVPIDNRLEQLYQVACLRQHYEFHGRAGTSNEPHGRTTSAAATTTSNESQPTTTTSNHNSSSGGPSLSIFTRSQFNPSAISAAAATLTSPISPPPTSGSRRPLSFNNPTLQWTSLIQLPFYPERMTSLTVEFSIPPSYDTVMTRTPFEATDPVAVPSATAPQLFLATFGCHSMIIDMNGALFTTQVYSWSEPPESHIAFMQLRPDDWYAVGFAKESVNVMHLVTGQSHRVMNGVPIRFLGQSSYRGGTLTWACANGKTNQVYSLSGSS
ncbi:hypothetical protein BC941DRAFT_424640 [Chlamydoabsidia padenii]|nr:hypothetical protein BC941DRAFT_424640 [Chlamydoabsidia padenii]